jgi:hypothetical protein
VNGVFVLYVYIVFWNQKSYCRQRAAPLNSTAVHTIWVVAYIRVTHMHMGFYGTIAWYLPHIKSHVVYDFVKTIIIQINLMYSALNHSNNSYK